MTDRQQGPLCLRKTVNTSKLLIFGMVTLLLTTGGFFLADGGAAAQSELMIRVGLATNSQGISFTSNGGHQLVDRATGKIIADLSVGDTWQVNPEGSSTTYILSAGGMTTTTPSAQVSTLGQEGTVGQVNLDQAFLTAEGGVPQLNSGVTLRQNGEVKGTYAGPVLVREIDPTTTNLFTYNSKKYRGALELKLDQQNALTVVNELPLEQYLYGVVASEMPSSWPSEALKAQAVAARNYVIRQKLTGRFAASGFDVTATDSSQVYGGFTAEKERTNSAVEATHGVIMLADGEPINAVYHSSSGGYTENSEEVWYYPTSYLKTKADTLDQNSLHYNWQFPVSGMMSFDEVKAKLLAVKGWNFATITNIVPEKLTTSGSRIQVLRIEGTDAAGNIKLERISNADSVRSAFGLKSGPREIWLNVGADQKPTGLVFRGSGWGHGLGMSQWGARGMALAGSDYRSILQYYYTDITLVENYAQ